MEQVVASYSQEPMMREFTIRLMKGLPNNDIRNQVARTVSFVKDNVTYIRDPNNSEYIVSPVRMLQGYMGYGFMAGDCDDHVVLLNTMLGSMGIPTKCVGVKFGGSPDFNHVISGVFITNSMTLIDPCAKGAAQPSYYDTLTV
jgi:transglutaminase-like putative cysteine protease